MIQMEELTVARIRELLGSGQITSRQLVLNYMERIALIDKSGPKLNSVLELNPDALYIAEAMDRERAKGKLHSPLHGIPILIKDNINTHDKMRTSAGSIALDDNFAPYDATVAKKLRDAGLIIMGKTNMTELANYMSYSMRNGYSSRGGQVINPYNSEGDVWGSSSGSAVAMSANLCALAIGTETDGSIIWPSHMNGTVGLKPTRGLVSRHGIIPICTAQDTAGPMTRCVADAAALLNIIVGEDSEDPSTWCRDVPEDYTAYLDVNGLRGLRLGLNRGYYEDFSEEQKQIAEDAFQALEKAGATLVSGTDLPHLRSDASVLLYEFKMCLNAYLSTNPSLRCHTLKDIIDFYGDHPQEGLKYGMSILLDAEYNTSGTCTDPKYILDKAACQRGAQEEGLLKLMDDNGIDVLVSPGISDASPISGYPSIIVPAGYTSDNMPFGVTFVGRPFSEPLLIRAAYAFEQCTKARRAPVFDL